MKKKINHQTFKLVKKTNFALHGYCMIHRMSNPRNLAFFFLKICFIKVKDIRCERTDCKTKSNATFVTL